MTTTNSRPAPERDSLLKRLGCWTLTFAALLAYKWWTIRLPASWDSSWAVIPGGVELVENGFDFRALFESPHFFELGPATNGQSPVIWLTAVVMLVVGRGESFLPALHVVHLAIGAVALRQVYVFGRSMWGHRASLMLTVTAAVLPVMNAQLGFIYLEIPQLAASMLAINAFRSNRTGRAAGWAALATAIKVAGIITPIALAATVVVLGRNRAAIRRALIVSVPSIAVALVGALYLSPVWTTASRSVSAVLRGTLGTLLSTVDITLLFLIPLLFAYRVFKSHRLSPEEQQAFVLSLWTIFGFISLYVLIAPLRFDYAMLPRYLVQLAPFALVAAALAGRVVFGRRALLVGGIILVSFSLINTTGRFYPAASTYNSVYQEHSIAYADMLELELVGFDALQELDDVPILVLTNQWFRGTYPEAGFVNRPLTNMEVIRSDRDLPVRFVILDTEDVDDFTTNQLIEMLVNNPEWTSRETEFRQGRFKIRLIEYSRR